jgi:hypothetical protein
VCVCQTDKAADEWSVCAVGHTNALAPAINLRPTISQRFCACVPEDICLLALNRGEVDSLPQSAPLLRKEQLVQSMAIRVAVLSLRKSVTYTHTPPRAYTGRPRRRRSQPSWKVLASSPTMSLPSQAHLRRRVSLPPRDQIHSCPMQSITHHTSS